MRAAIKVVAVAVLVAAAMLAVTFFYVRSAGLRAQPEPGPIETRLARTIRGLAIPAEIKARSNPLGASEEAFWPGLEHFARYYTMCHSNDGSGKDAPIGWGLFP